MIGPTLRQLRIEAKLSQRALARRCGLRQATISDIERGIGDCRLSTVQTILTALGRSWADVAPETPTATPCNDD